jgi:hypothetical protein
MLLRHLAEEQFQLAHMVWCAAAIVTLQLMQLCGELARREPTKKNR